MDGRNGYMDSWQGWLCTMKGEAYQEVIDDSTSDVTTLLNGSNAGSVRLWLTLPRYDSLCPRRLVIGRISSTCWDVLGDQAIGLC